MARVDTEALLARTDLVEVVGRYVKLRRAGTEHTGLCPFHNESTPSFTVIPKKGFVHCFGYFYRVHTIYRATRHFVA